MLEELKKLKKILKIYEPSRTSGIELEGYKFDYCFVTIIRAIESFQVLIELLDQSILEKKSLALLVYIEPNFAGSIDTLNVLCSRPRNYDIHFFDVHSFSPQQFHYLLAVCDSYIHLLADDTNDWCLKSRSLNKRLICLNDKGVVLETDILVPMAAPELVTSRALLIDEYRALLKASVISAESKPFSEWVEQFDDKDYDEFLEQVKALIIDNTPLQQLTNLEYLSERYLKAGNYDRVIPVLTMLLEIRPASFKVFQLMGLYFLDTDLSKALDYFDKALLVNDSCQETYTLYFNCKQRYQERLKKPVILLNTLPKSGSVFIATTLIDTLDLEFSYISPALFVSDVVNYDIAENLCLRGGYLSQSHLFAYDLNLKLIQLLFDKMIVHVRDPRQALLSWAHHILKYYESPRIYLRFDMGIDLPHNYRDRSFEQQLDWLIEHYFPKQLEWLRGWLRAHSDPGFKTDILFTNYRDFHSSSDQFWKSIQDFYQFENL